MSIKSMLRHGSMLAIIVLAAGCSVPDTPSSPVVTPTVTDESAQVTASVWQDRVFYEVFVRSFYDSDGDGVGDLRGLVQKLDYLNDGDPSTSADLGVTGLWLMPIMESPSYHGYDVTDYRSVQPDYGTNDDFKELIRQAHDRGIVVIIDMPLNHTSDQNEWFVEAQSPRSPYHDWYIWSENDPGYLGPWNERVWHPLGESYYYGIFTSGMPDLNYRNRAVSAEMKDVARFWLEEMGADGFRLDAARHLIEDGDVQASSTQTHAWLDGYSGFMKSVKQDSLLVGEVWSTSREVASYVGNHQLDLAFEFDLASAMVNAFQTGDAGYLRATQRQVLELYPPGQYAAFLTNHDQERVMSELGGDQRKARAAAVLLLTNPGVPFIYYGEEIGMIGEKPDEHIRTPMAWNAQSDTAGFTVGSPWATLSSGYETANVEIESASAGSLLDTYRKLIEIRRTYGAFSTGDTLLVDSSSKSLYAYLRTTPDETLLVIVNLSDEPVSDYSLMLASGPIHDGSKATVLWEDGDAGDPAVSGSGGFADYRPIDEVGPFSSVIIQFTEPAPGP